MINLAKLIFITTFHLQNSKLDSFSSIHFLKTLGPLRDQLYITCT